MKKHVFLPFRGEFGYFIMQYIRFVHAYPCAEKIVCCSPTHQVYFPSADSFIYHDSFKMKDADRHMIGEREGLGFHFLPIIHELVQDFVPIAQGEELSWDDLLSIDVKLTPRNIRNLFCDVVVAPRNRAHDSHRNFEHWQIVVDILSNAGYRVATVGSADASRSLNHVTFQSWQFPDEDAAVELMLNTRIFIGTDSGVSHLAALMKKPIVFFRTADNAINFTDLLSRQTPTFMHIHDGWRNPREVASSAIKYLESTV